MLIAASHTSSSRWASIHFALLRGARGCIHGLPRASLTHLSHSLLPVGLVGPCQSIPCSLRVNALALGRGTRNISRRGESNSAGQISGRPTGGAFNLDLVYRSPSQPSPCVCVSSRARWLASPGAPSLLNPPAPHLADLTAAIFGVLSHHLHMAQPLAQAVTLRRAAQPGCLRPWTPGPFSRAFRAELTLFQHWAAAHLHTQAAGGIEPPGRSCRPATRPGHNPVRPSVDVCAPGTTGIVASRIFLFSTSGRARPAPCRRNHRSHACPVDRCGSLSAV